MTAVTDLALGWGRVGLFGFGGGPGMIPLMQVECVQTQGWVTDEQFLEALAAASALPGPIAVKMSVMIGAQTAGVPGAIAALVGVVVPAVTLISVLAGLLTQYRQAPAVSGAMRAVQPAVIGLSRGPWCPSHRTVYEPPWGTDRWRCARGAHAEGSPSGGDCDRDGTRRALSAVVCRHAESIPRSSA